MKRLLALFFIMLFFISSLTGCGKKGPPTLKEPEKGTYNERAD
ncbi:MAG: lipopeptide [Nitrospirae bacterium]|nr:MAG: lipopeptide [Nitrospirota bacterium]